MLNKHFLLSHFILLSYCYCKHTVFSIRFGLGLRFGNITHKWALITLVLNEVGIGGRHVKASILTVPINTYTS